MSGWTVSLLNQAVVAELEAMPADIRARFGRIAMLIERPTASREQFT
jgi:hypothetical protein